MLLKNLGDDFHRSRKCPPVNPCFILAWRLTIKDYAKTDLEAEQYQSNRRGEEIRWVLTVTWSVEWLVSRHRGPTNLSPSYRVEFSAVKQMICSRLFSHWGSKSIFISVFICLGALLFSLAFLLCASWALSPSPHSEAELCWKSVPLISCNSIAVGKNICGGAEQQKHKKHSCSRKWSLGWVAWSRSNSWPEL